MTSFLVGVAGFEPTADREKHSRLTRLERFVMLLVFLFLRLRRRKLRIIRARAIQKQTAQALNHSAAPPLPEKSAYFSGAPFDAGRARLRHLVPHIGPGQARDRGIRPLQQKRSHAKSMTSFLVGVAGFEPTASWSRTKRATICATPRLICECLAIISAIAQKVKS